MGWRDNTAAHVSSGDSGEHWWQPPDPNDRTAKEQSHSAGPHTHKQGSAHCRCEGWRKLWLQILLIWNSFPSNVPSYPGAVFLFTSFLHGPGRISPSFVQKLHQWQQRCWWMDVSGAALTSGFTKTLFLILWGWFFIHWRKTSARSTSVSQRSGFRRQCTADYPPLSRHLLKIFTLWNVPYNLSLHKWIVRAHSKICIICWFTNQCMTSCWWKIMFAIYQSSHFAPSE